MISDLYNDNGELLVSPGECWDRLTILELKIISIQDEEKQKTIAGEWRRVSQLIEHIHATGCIPKEEGLPAWHKLVHLTHRLHAQNTLQWMHEDKVRKEKSWEAAQAARESNTRRVAVKNKINQLYGYAEDVKQYAGDNNE